ncbi:LLM class flavin-dependent oxidoreductase [Dictyobacter aurantiacus]|uniref:Luciferase-like protein n=1 Tax=Dictyobacter aurantiacus TaxID=1936993 RepID=A0A401ZGU5_9CHLR|nr:LLM class flavin-dependent oxidoreductase [Dictyobacter aurantiacus]GCE06072.1 luciferase-like protein [Dictyobacter aurantiacus]
MQYGLDIPTAGAFADPRTLAELAVEAEEAGWDGFFLWDTIFMPGHPEIPVVDPWIALAAIAMRTQRIKLGAFLTPLPRRRPWQVARESVGLDHLSNGRLIFGAALGYHDLDFTPFGESFDPHIRAEKLDEGLAILDGFWSGETFSFDGKHYQIHDVSLQPGPLQSPRIPIWLAGGWPRRKPLRRAARWDGIYLMTNNQDTGRMLTPAEVREAISYINANRIATGPFDVALNVKPSEDKHQNAELVRQYSDAGATWWIELEPTDQVTEQSFAAYREHIRRGPPA